MIDRPNEKRGMPWYCLAEISSKNSQDNLIEPSDNSTKILYEQFGLAKSIPKLN